jgi:hypothetical protein
MVTLSLCRAIPWNVAEFGVSAVTVVFNPRHYGLAGQSPSDLGNFYPFAFDLEF